MSPNPNTSSTAYLPQDTQKAVDTFEALGTDEKLALLYFIYKKMGDSITPAAPTATEPELTPTLMGDFFELGHDDQLATMRQIVNREDTELSRAYGALKENNQLMVWYAWAQSMGHKVVDIPQGYQPVKAINDALGHIEDLEFQEQMSLLREVAGSMGYSDVKAIPTQAETGKTSSL